MLRRRKAARAAGGRLARGRITKKKIAAQERKKKKSKSAQNLASSGRIFSSTTLNTKKETLPRARSARGAIFCVFLGKKEQGAPQ